MSICIPIENMLTPLVTTEVVTKWGQGDEHIEQSGVTNLKGGW
jgi:hypothetical protein